MKPFYGIDRTENKKNTIREGGCFIAAGISGITGSVVEQAAKSADGQNTRAGLPKPLGFVRNSCGFLAFILFFSLIRSARKVTFAQACENAPWVFWILGVCAAVWAVLSVIAAVIGKNVRATDEYAMAQRRLEGALQSAYRELGVPQDAKDVDVIAISHKWKNGKMKPVAYGLEISERYNISFKVFRREDKLCLVDLEHRYELPLSELRCLRSVKKHIYSKGWNKAEQYDVGYYKPYKLTTDNYGRIHMNRYGLLELHHNGEDWAVWLPPYELNYISALTGLPITQE